MAGNTVVLGVNGQDGTLIAKRLLARGRPVVGLGRQSSSRFDHEEGFSYRQCDLRDRSALSAVLDEVRPNRVFHLAAVHASAAHNAYEQVFGEMLDVNVGSLHVVLEHARRRDGDLRILYAGSAKCFGPLPAVIDESTPRRGSCLYSITKNAGASLIDHYRRAHGIRAGVLYLFNHESALRPPEFFIPKLVRAVVSARAGSSVQTSFFTLDFVCDWGSADEYMDLAIDVLEEAPGEDFVVATGTTTNARELVGRTFERFGLDANSHVVTEQSSQVPPKYRVHIDKLARLVGRRPVRTIDEVIAEMVAAYEAAEAGPSESGHGDG